ncbi:MAG TPA: hypothetical protein VJ752_04275 [Burkholderiaceae bacterium]|nr:hypothetical protein [Burkholderiaceae bacterium]
MTYTLAAVFEHRADANYARDALVSAGFDSHAVQLSDAASATGAARQQDATASPGATDESMLDSVRHFFGRLFGTGHDDQRMVAEALRRGHVVLTVHSASSEQAERAAGILQAFGPADMGRQRTREDSGAWRPAGAAMQQSDTGASQGQPQQRAPASSAGGEVERPQAPPQAGQSRQGAATPESMQRAPSAARMPDEGGEAAARQGAGGYTGAHPNQDSLNIQRGDDLGVSEETYFHAHWVDTYSYTGGTYQEYDPAYRYGASMASSTTYQGSDWDEVEPALREEWQRTYPESRWEKFKEAVRAGWNRMTH